VLFVCLVLLGAPAVWGEELLTNAADVISLPAERAARSIKVLVTGVVTAADPTLKGRFFVQDSTGGVFVDNANGPRPEPGDVVEVSGISHVGAYAPIITAPSLRKIGAKPLPPAKPIPVERLMSGAEDSQRIEISGIVRAARVDGSRLDVDLVTGGYRFRAYAPIPPGMDPQTLVAAHVRVRGTAAEAHNRSLRQLIAAEVYVPVLADFVVEESETTNPFNEPVIPVNGLAQYRRDNSLSRRVHVRGTVTLQRLGESLFLQDATGGLQVQSRELTSFSPGQVIEAVGFPSFDNFLPVLQDAAFRTTPEPRVALNPKPASVAEFQNGLHHAELVSLKGKVMDRAVRHMRRQSTDPTGTRTTLVLQSDNFVFTAEADEPRGEGELSSIPVGSTVQVNGVCLTEIDSDGKMKSFRLLLGSPRDVRIIQKPSWFTPQRLLVGFAMLGSVLIIIVTWTVMLSRKNSALNYLIREREKAQVELQQAHDQLEHRVRERTAELKLQITARKESELQFKGVLAERTRLAQELHDTLEQSLTGIRLQLDTAAKLFEKSRDGGQRHLELARNLMTQSQVELRRSIWDLRSRELEEFDLPSAMRLSAQQILEGTRVAVEVETTGDVRPLSEVVEENLLRIAQEALTNVIKHASASEVRISLEFGPQAVTLRVKDNGQGFTPDNCPGSREGHFGLLGMSERAKRLNGHLRVTSTPGNGTCLKVEIPIKLAEETDKAAAADARGLI
jgi:signal transduction histidine kinase